MSTPVRLAILVVALAGFGTFSAVYVSYDTDPLKLLPADVPEVEGLRLYQEHFGTDVDLILTLAGDEPAIVENAARKLSEHLLAEEGLVKRADWQPPGMDDLSEYGDLIAYAWLNGPAENVEALSRRLAAGRSREIFADAVGTLATGFDAEEMFRAGHDPLGLTEVFDAEEVDLRGNGNGQFSFASPDGSYRLVFIDAPGELYDYAHTIPWLERIFSSIEAWRENGSPEAGSVRIDHTGRAPYIAEVATALQREMYISVAITLTVIVALFWFVHRRLLPLFCLVVCLGLVFVITLSIGGLIYGDLGASSAGFAAILVGLVVDYAFILYQESKAERDPRRLRRKMLHSIGWASATTAAVFFGLNLSLLPGSRQFGTVVAIGIVTGAVVVMGVFAWLIGLLGPPAPGKEATRDAPGPGGTSRRLPLAVTMVAVLAAGTVLATGGFPGISPSADALRPKRSHALDVLSEILDRMGDREATRLRFVLSADSDGQLREIAQRVSSELDAESRTPLVLIPNEARQNANRASLAGLGRALPRLGKEADEAGLAPAAFAMADRVLGTWAGLGEGVFYPSGDSSRWLLDKMIARDTNPVCALGTIVLPKQASEEAVTRILDDVRELGGSPAGWDHLRPAILRLIEHEYRWVLIPVTAILALMLLLAFRRVRSVMLSIATIGFSGVCLLAAMTLAGIEWNLINLGGIPLILGAGLDYSIHMQLALKRLGGDLRAVQRTTGKALLLCGASTSTGFATLANSSNAGVESLGLVCAAGLAITMLTAVFLLPRWWAMVCQREPEPPPP